MRKIWRSALAGAFLASALTVLIVTFWKPYYQAGYLAGQTNSQGGGASILANPPNNAAFTSDAGA